MRDQFTEWWSELGPIQVQNWWPHYELAVADDVCATVGAPLFLNDNAFDLHVWKPRIYGVTLYGDGRIEYRKDVFE